MTLRKSFFLSLLAVFLISACHKSGSQSASYVGEWQLTRVLGGPLIDLAPISRESVTILRLQPDSTLQELYNSRLLYTGNWSVRQEGTPTNTVMVMTFRSAISSGSTAIRYQASLVGNKLTLQMLNVSPDLSYQATYTRR
jgi:hypothetical protein